MMASFKELLFIRLSCTNSVKSRSHKDINADIYQTYNLKSRELQW